MKSHPLVKVVTVTLFVALIAGLVAFETGNLPIGKSTGLGDVDTPRTSGSDTTLLKQVRFRVLPFPSSKSFILISHDELLKMDTNKLFKVYVQDTIFPRDSAIVVPVISPSSKSRVILPQQELLQFFKEDSVRNPK